MQKMNTWHKAGLSLTLLMVFSIIGIIIMTPIDAEESEGEIITLNGNPVAVLSSDGYLYHHDEKTEYYVIDGLIYSDLDGVTDYIISDDNEIVHPGVEYGDSASDPDSHDSKSISNPYSSYEDSYRYNDNLNYFEVLDYTNGVHILSMKINEEDDNLLEWTVWFDGPGEYSIVIHTNVSILFTTDNNYDKYNYTVTANSSGVYQGFYGSRSSATSLPFTSIDLTLQAFSDEVFIAKGSSVKITSLIKPTVSGLSGWGFTNTSPYSLDTIASEAGTVVLSWHTVYDSDDDGINDTKEFASLTIHVVSSGSTKKSLEYSSSPSASNLPSSTSKTNTAKETSFKISMTQAPTLSGKVFLGWTLDQDSTHKLYHNGDTVDHVTGKTILYAVWGTPVSSVSGFRNMDFDNGNIALTSDIRLTSWTPKAFFGYLDGQGHKITYSTTTVVNNCTGLFSKMGGTIINTRVDGDVDVSISVSKTITFDDNKHEQNVYGGIIAGILEGKVEQCTVTGSISVVSTVNLSASKSNVSYAKHNLYVGGIAGLTKSSWADTEITDCVSTASVYADAQMQYTNIAPHDRIYCYAGGIVGAASGGPVMYSYVDSDQIISKVTTNKTPTYSDFIATAYWGGIDGVGTNCPTCYYNSSVITDSDSTCSFQNNPTSDTSMKKQSTYSGWKFGNVVTADDGSTHPVWLINEGSTYPFLYATASKITIQEQSADFMDYGSTDYVYQLNLTGIDTLDLDKIEVVAAWIGDDYNYNNSTSTKLKYDSSSRSISVPKLNLEPGSHYYTVTVSCPGYIAGTATVTVKINIQIKNPQLENATAGTEWQYTVDVGSNYTNKVAISSWDVYNSSGISIKNSDPIIEKTGNLKFVGHFSSLSTAAVYYLQYTISGEGYGSDTSPRIQIVVAEPAVEKPSFSRIEVGRNSGDNSFIFTCIGPQNVAEYIWVFDDGQRGDSRQNISRDFTVPGDHYVDLTVKNSNGDTYGPIRSETFVASDNRQGYAILGEEYETDKYDVSGLNGMSYTLDANWPSDVTLTRHYENGKGWYTATVPDKAEYNNIQSRLTLWFDEVKWYVDVVFMYRTVVDDSSIKFDYEFLGNGVVKFSFPSSIQYTTSASIAEFRNTLAGNPSWDFGDGTKSSGFEIDSKKYSTPGTKSVTITYAFKSERTTAHSYTATITVPEFDNGGDEPSQTHITNEWLNNLDTVWKAKPNESFGIIVDTTGIKNVTIRSDSDVFQYVYGAIIGEPKEVGTYNITIEITLNDGSNTVESKTIQIVVEEENDYQQIIQVAVILAVIGIVGVLAITRFT